MKTDSAKRGKYQGRLIYSPQFWSIVSIFVLITLHHYNDQSSFSLFSFPDKSLGLTRHTIDRILYFIPIILSSVMFGPRGGIAALVMALFAMLPRAVLISESHVTALLETLGVMAIGSFAPLWAIFHEKQERRLELTMERLESTQKKLHSKVQLSLEQKKQLAVINSFSTILSQSLDIKRVVQTAIAMVQELMQVEVVLVFSLDKLTQELRIVAFEGIREESALPFDEARLGEVLCGRVVKTGQALAVENILGDPEASCSTIQAEQLRAQLSVPLVARGEIIGALCVATRELRQFKEPEIHLLSALGNLIGVAVDNSHLFQERETAAEKLKSSEKKYRKLFENAHDAIWVQDLSGTIIAANQAAGDLFGCDLSELIGADSQRFLPSESLSTSRTIQDDLITGREKRLPYKQTVIKKDGTKAIIRMTTNLVSSNSHPEGFQFIGRDITNEERMQENQTFYLQQITQAHEEERLRISRDLHDSTAQNLIAALHQLEEFCEADNNLPKTKLQPLWNLHDQIKNTLQEIRQLSRDLRPSIIDDLGILPAVEWLTEQLRTEYNIDANLNISGEERRFPPEIEVTLFRIVQEALRNIARHSMATEAQVDITLKNTKTKVTITDNGVGFAIPASLGEFSRVGKLGIDGMQTRARTVGGTFDIKSESNKGTTISIIIPA